MVSHQKNALVVAQILNGEKNGRRIGKWLSTVQKNVSENEKNYRMFQQINGLKRLSNIDEVKLQAANYLDLLSTGQI